MIKISFYLSFMWVVTDRYLSVTYQMKQLVMRNTIIYFLNNFKKLCCLDYLLNKILMWKLTYPLALSTKILGQKFRKIKQDAIVLTRVTKYLATKIKNTYFYAKGRLFLNIIQMIQCTKRTSNYNCDPPTKFAKHLAQIIKH